MSERRFTFWTTGEEMIVGNEFLKFDIGNKENDVDELIEIHQLHQAFFVGLQSFKTPVKKIRQNSQAIETDTSGAVLGTIGNILAGITKPILSDFYNDTKKAVEQLSQVEIDDDNTTHSTVFKTVESTSKTDTDFVGLYDDIEKEEELVENNKIMKPKCKYEKYIESIAIVKMKRGAERRLNSASLIKQLPFVLTTSTTPSHNLSINIQQIINMARTKQQSRKKQNPFLVSGNIYSCLLSKTTINFEPLEEDKKTTSELTVVENEKNKITSSENEIITTKSIGFEETFNKFNGCVPPIISVKTKNQKIRNEQINKLIADMDEKDSELLQQEKEKLEQILKTLL